MHLPYSAKAVKRQSLFEVALQRRIHGACTEAASDTQHCSTKDRTHLACVGCVITVEFRMVQAVTMMALAASAKGCGRTSKPRSATALCRPLMPRACLAALVAFCCLSAARSATSCWPVCFLEGERVCCFVLPETPGFANPCLLGVRKPFDDFPLPFDGGAA